MVTSVVWVKVSGDVEETEIVFFWKKKKNHKHESPSHPIWDVMLFDLQINVIIC